ELLLDRHPPGARPGGLAPDVEQVRSLGEQVAAVPHRGHRLEPAATVAERVRRHVDHTHHQAPLHPLQPVRQPSHPSHRLTLWRDEHPDPAIGDRRVDTLGRARTRALERLMAIGARPLAAVTAGLTAAVLAGWSPA